MDRHRTRLVHGAAKLRELLDQFERFVQEPSARLGEIERIQKSINRLVAQQTVLLAEMRFAPLASEQSGMLAPDAPGREVSPGAHGGLRQRPMREVVLDALADINVPATPREISAFAQACYDTALTPERFASLRRDEERAYRNNPTTRPAWIVPALNCVSLTPIARIVATSAWKPEQRLIGTRTLRVNYLCLLQALLHFRQRAEGAQDGPAAGPLAALIRQYAETVPGALERGHDLEYQRIKAAVEAELRHIEPTDRRERLAAARKLADMPETYQLWGRPAALEGGALERSQA